MHSLTLLRLNVITNATYHIYLIFEGMLCDGCLILCLLSHGSTCSNFGSTFILQSSWSEQSFISMKLLASHLNSCERQASTHTSRKILNRGFLRPVWYQMRNRRLREAIKYFPECVLHALLAYQLSGFF